MLRIDLLFRLTSSFGYSFGGSLDKLRLDRHLADLKIFAGHHELNEARSGGDLERLRQSLIGLAIGGRL